MPFLKIRDLDELWYEQAGEGPDLLIISGTGGDLRCHPNALETPLTRHFRVTSYDQRGLGRTSKPEGRYTMANYADDAAAVMDALELAPCPVLGISFGGMVLQNLVVRHPEMVTHMALFCTSPGGAGGSSYPLHTLPPMEPEEKFRASMKLYDNRTTDDWFETEQAEMLRRRADKSAFAGEPNFLRGSMGQLHARSEHNCWEDLANVTNPAFCAGGTNDEIATPEAMKNLADRLPNGELHLYDGGHMFFITVPEAYDDLRAFFSRQ